MKSSQISKFKYAAAPLALGLALISTPSFAQEEAAEEEEAGVIVVTGSILKRPVDAATPSPVTTVTAEELDKRGVTTIQEAIQTLTSNNGPALTNSFTANGAFGAGASAVSLRGLSTSSTLVLFDGLRAAYYPLSDDGARNFVDLNTIQDDVVDRIEVLRDGASSSYGADAIAGVVNVITKKQYQGIGGRVEAGVSERGDAQNQRLSLIGGYGDLDEQGFNVYASGFYYHASKLKNSARPYPFNTDDERAICYDDGTGQVCGPNNVLNGLNNAGVYSGLDIASNFLVRPYDATNTTAQGPYQQLGTAGCTNGLIPYTLTAAERADPANAIVPASVCQEDITQLYGNILPEIERFGGTVRSTFRIGDSTEAYIQANFLQSTVNYTGLPATIRANAPAGILFPRFSTSATTGVYGNRVLTLPVFVCPQITVQTCTAANGTLNPNNPFAAAGQVARILGRLQNITEYNETRNRSFRFAAGVTGTVFSDWDYQFDLTGMLTDLRRTSAGYVYIQNLLNVINDGSYNFVNPALNSQATLDYVAPTNITDSSSELYQAQFVVGKSLLELPGGPLQLGVGVSARYEAVDAPSANPDYNGPTQRYFRLNAFGTKGDRKVYSAFAELNAPIVDMVEVNLSGRYDKYSNGPGNFSPKAGVKFQPIPQLAIRGTYSRGFRIPSFAESNALPTTGFVTNSSGLFNNTYLAQYGCTVATFTTCPAYIRTGSYGLTTIGTQGLQPEKSRSFTGGVIFEPVRNVTLTFDYYNIKKTNAITSADTGPAITAYYSGQPIPAGITVIPDAVDPNFPNAQPRIAFVQSGFVNANSQKSEGFDFSATGRFEVANDVTFTSSIEGSYIIELSTSFPSGGKESYAGTLGNFNLTAGSGTPRWKGSWVNTIQYGAASLTASANYYGGYNLSAEDQGGVSGDCGLSSGFTPCDVGSYTTVDLTGEVEVNDKFTFYVNVLNLLDDLPPIDHVTYGAHLYNAVQGGTGIIGRSFRAGVRFKL